MQPKTGGKLHLKLNTGVRPIANKYREGKMKRTLKRELKRKNLNLKLFGVAPSYLVAANIYEQQE